MRLTFMPLAEELARRGHSVTVVMPFEYEGKDKPKTLVIDIFKSIKICVMNLCGNLLFVGSGFLQEHLPGAPEFVLQVRGRDIFF